MIRKKFINFAFAAAFFLGVMALSYSPMTSAQGSSNPQSKVTLCHATNSDKNSYDKITVSANATVEGHDKHSDNIIPPFTYTEKGEQKRYPGKNWDARGQAIYNNDCEIPAGGRGAGQVSGLSTTPSGSVNAGGGGTASTINSTALAGLIGSLALSVLGALVALKRL